MIMVDNTEASKKTEEKFGYIDQTGGIDYVEVRASENSVRIVEADGDCVYIYNEDIPKMIKALQAAYNFAKEDK